MKYGTLVRIPESDHLAAVAREKFAALTAMGMDACQLVYKPAVYKMDQPVTSVMGTSASRARSNCSAKL